MTRKKADFTLPLCAVHYSKMATVISTANLSTWPPTKSILIPRSPKTDMRPPQLDFDLPKTLHRGARFKCVQHQITSGNPDRAVKHLRVVDRSRRLVRMSRAVHPDLRVCRAASRRRTRSQATAADNICCASTLRNGSCHALAGMVASSRASRCASGFLMSRPSWHSHQATSFEDDAMVQTKTARSRSSPAKSCMRSCVRPNGVSQNRLARDLEHESGAGERHRAWAFRHHRPARATAREVFRHHARAIG